MHGVINPERYGVLSLLIGLVFTTVVTRWMTRRIRTRELRNEKRLRDRFEDVVAEQPDSVIKNVVIAGIHIHHQLWGMLGCLVAGLLLVTYSPTGWPLYALAFFFGGGAALVLDEFAMWLHLKDVYWANEGRASISALLVAATVTLALVLGLDPLDMGARATGQRVPGAVLALIALVDLVLAVVCILKGKLSLGLVGLVVPLLALVGAIRLAKPDSWWARRHYPQGSGRLERARSRFGPDYDRWFDGIRDFIGGRHGDRLDDHHDRLHSAERADYRHEERYEPEGHH